MSDHDVEKLVAKYRIEIAAEAELARGDLDEIEDHLRTLVDDLRERGMPLAEAVETAALRLGKPRELAVEHSRVRTAFGARLSRARAWSAAALLAAATIYMADRGLSRGLLTIPALHLVAWLGVIAALAMRRTWARALAVGIVVPTLLVQLVHLVELATASPSAFGLDTITALTIKAGVGGGECGELVMTCALMVAALVFVAPWRRSELSRRGVAAALLGLSYVGGLGALMFYADLPDAIVANPLGSLALVAAIVAIVGVVRSAAWASVAALIAGCALGMLGAHALVASEYVILGETQIADEIGGLALLGAGSAVVAAIALWRGKLAAMLTAQ
ncbi:MAG TPA: hypothetical protein VGG28_33695 [Kofleriaceae bacterium]